MDLPLVGDKQPARSEERRGTNFVSPHGSTKFIATPGAIEATAPQIEVRGPLGFSGAGKLSRQDCTRAFGNWKANESGFTQLKSSIATGIWPQLDIYTKSNSSRHASSTTLAVLFSAPFTLNDIGRAVLAIHKARSLIARQLRIVRALASSFAPTS
jgi:hypothetical protein